MEETPMSRSLFGRDGWAALLVTLILAVLLYL
jgi:hypothetical protein